MKDDLPKIHFWPNFMTAGNLFCAATVGDRALRFGHLVADERVAAPPLIDVTVERDPATRRSSPVAARVPKGLVVAVEVDTKTSLVLVVAVGFAMRR